MKKLRILFVNDFASNAFMFEKYMPCDIDVIYFADDPVISPVKNKLYFEGNFNNWVKQIKELSQKYDLLICLGWPAAAICYLASVNYVMYFVDVYIAPKDRLLGKEMPSFQKNIILEIFKEALDHSNQVVGCDPNITNILSKYRPEKNTIFSLVDPQMFNLEIAKIDLGTSKFIFFSPQRIEQDKRQLIMWEAINLTSSDFIVLQTNWGGGTYYDQAIAKKPDKVKIIPKIPRDKIPSYFASSCALLGQISKTTCANVEREAILSGIPVFCYSPLGFTDDDPFYKKSTNPADIAEYVDKIVNDGTFRAELAKRQHEWLLETFNNERIIQEWEKIFEIAIKQKRNYKVKAKLRIILWILSIYQKITKKQIDINFLKREDLNVFTADTP